MEHPKPWLRYVEAGDIANKTFNFQYADVRNLEGDRLGTIDGLIVDASSGRTYYVVVDAGGWFKSPHFLVPIGQLDRTRNAFVVNLSRRQVNHFPGFNPHEFESLTEPDVKHINDTIRSVFRRSRTYIPNEPFAAAWERRSSPPSPSSRDWWDTAPMLPNRMGARFARPVEHFPAGD